MVRPFDKTQGRHAHHKMVRKIRHKIFRGIKKMHRHKGVFASVFAIGALGIAALFLFIFLLIRDLPTIEQITHHTVTESTKIYDRTGTLLLYEINAGEKRTVVPFDDIPKNLVVATIAIEDEGFYTNPPFSVRGMFRAFLVNLRHGKVLQGGSTITQQLAKKAFLTDERTIARKIKELFLAIQIDRHYTKDQIIELYLNEIPYGSTLYGVESASRAYFGKPSKDLSRAESATLAALPKAPSYYSPWGTHTKELIERSHLVLKKMRALNYIDDRELAASLEEKIVFLPQDTTGIRAPHFVIAVQEYLVSKYGENFVRTGGLSVRTTLDWKLQEIAERVIKEGAERNESLYGGTNAALVAEDARTGEVLALVGSRDYFNVAREGNFNVATQGLRQPGSALKPLVYLSAFTRGYTPETIVFDVPTEFSTYPECPAVPIFREEETRCFHPQNFDGIFRGPVTLKRALAESINVPAVKVLYLAGVNYTLELLQNFGLNTLNNPQRFGLSLVLGGGEVRLIDLVHAYSTLAQDGTAKNRTTVLEVRDKKGAAIESFSAKKQRVVDAQYTRMINAILSDQELRAGLFQSSLGLTVFPNHEVALKTGTTNDYRDAWAIGYTPSLVAGVWAGNNDNTPMHARGSSILAAVPIWSAFMKEALNERPLETFIRPDPITTEKPILRGELPEREIHSILYYIDRSDPLGNSLHDPHNDPQFKNWEESVLAWGSYSIFDFSSYNQSAFSSGFSNTPVSDGITVLITTPSSGAFITEGFSITANIKSTNTITGIKLYQNGSVIRSYEGNFGTSYTFSEILKTALSAQNLIRVEAVNDKKYKGDDEIIVYTR